MTNEPPYTVLRLLHENKDSARTEEDFIKLQESISNLTSEYDDIQSIFEKTPNLIRLMISPDKISAKEYLKSCNLSSNELSYILYFDTYSLEAIMIYVLGCLFHCMGDSPAVRVSTLIDHLDQVVITQAKLMKARCNPSDRNDEHSSNNGNNELISKSKKMFGVYLVEFLVSREVITLSKELNFNKLYVAKKKGKYYLPKSYYAVCNFDISLLPIKLNLPMVYPPMHWEKTCEHPTSISDLRGGYLSMPIGNLYRHNLLSSHDFNHFNIRLEDYQSLCNTMNMLQVQSFEINKDVLTFIKENHSKLVEFGLLMPSFLASINVSAVADLLRKTYLEDPSLIKSINYNDLIQEFMTRIQRARYETFVISLADAYSGYVFFLPAFLDFRGRIYRSGVLHFHERDLARSLIVFSKINYFYSTNVSFDFELSAVAAFHYKKFTSYEDAHQWYIDQKPIFEKSDESLIQFAVDASSPYQFISKVICLAGKGLIHPCLLPITQDASASAFQIMSIFLLDNDLAKHTNIVPTKDDDQRIHDVYTFILEELKGHLQLLYTNQSSLYNLICSRLTQKLIKILFMPMVYGKTIISMSNDIHHHYSSLLSKKESMQLALHIKQFFRDRFPDIEYLMHLIRNIAWISSNLSKPVVYTTPIITTVQAYMKMKAVNLWVYNRILKKRHQVTLRISMDNSDIRKTNAATFANFIHHVDAYIAMNMIQKMFAMKAPVYTVHDNFITTAPYAMKISHLYIEILINDFHPLYVINSYMTHNLLVRWVPRHPLDRPLSLKNIKEILVGRIPSNLDKNKKNIWYKKIDLICEAYTNYLAIFCNYDMEAECYTCSTSHSKKLLEFYSKMSAWRFYKYNYCLHL